MDDILDQAFPVENQVAAPDPVVPEVTSETVAEPVAAEPVTTDTPEPVEQQRGNFVPIAAVLDERDRRKTAEAELAEFKRNQVQARPQAPDPFDDPQGYDTHLRGELGRAMAQQRMDTSYLIATGSYGKEAVEAAREWAIERGKNNPGFAAELDQQPHPIDWIVQQHKRDGLISQLPTDVSSIDELVEREIAKRGLTAPAAATTIQPVAAIPVLKPAAPPASIASQAAASAATVSDPQAEFNAIFSR